jgi:pimeloyl-ACP methyl ester carboxylesterase
MIAAEELRLPGRVGLAALRYNAGAPQRLLALHGWLDNAASFAPLAAVLPEWEIVALEFAGHGRSQHLPAGGWYHFVDYLDDVLAAQAALGEPRCHLLGHSLGGAVATCLAAACPERVDRLLLIEALGPLSSAPGNGLRALREGVAARQALAGKQRRVFEGPDVAVAARLQANRMQASSARLLIERGIEAVDGGYSWSSDPRLTAFSPARFSEALVQEWIAAVEAPTLIIAAEQHPPYFEAALREQRFALLRDGRAVVLPGDHHLHMDSPEPVAQAIRAFLATERVAAEA